MNLNFNLPPGCSIREIDAQFQSMCCVCGRLTDDVNDEHECPRCSEDTEDEETE